MLWSMTMNLPITLQTDEEVVTLLRRHPVRVITEIIGTLLAIIILVAVLLFLKSLMSLGLWDILIAIVVIVGIIYALMAFYRYQNDIWLITTQRIVDSTKRTPFNHEIASADLANVQDISISRRGILQTAFNYGNVRCQTASQTQVFTFIGVPDPNAVLELLDDTRDKARRRRRMDSGI